LFYRAAMIDDSRTKSVCAVRVEILKGSIKGELFFPERGCDAYIRQTRTGWGADEINIATQAAPRHRAFHFAGRGAIGVGKHHPFERHGHYQQTQDLTCAWPAGGGEVHFAPRKPNLPGTLAIEINGSVGIEVLQLQYYATIGPITRNVDFAFIP